MIRIWLRVKIQKILLDFYIQMDHPIQATKPDLVMINNEEKICDLVDFTFWSDHRPLNESITQVKCLDTIRELK